MAYKKYIKRGGKVYGPYIYHSKKVKGKVISEYLGKDEEKKKNKRKQILIFLIITLIIFSLIIGLNYNKIDFNNAIRITTSTLNNIITPITKTLTGFAVSGDSKNESENEGLASPISHWKMNDNLATTDAIDSVGSNEGTAQQNTDQITVTGKINTALTFNGVDDYIDCGNDESLNITDEITISIWVKANSLVDYDTPIMKTESNGWDTGYGFYYDIGFMTFGVGAEGSWIGHDQAKVTFTSGELGEWHHFVGTYDGTTVRIYKDSIEGASVAKAGGITTTTSPLEIGRGSSNDYNWDGVIDEVRIYNRVLSESEILELYNSEQGSLDTFDLRILDGSVEFENITGPGQLKSQEVKE